MTVRILARGLALLFAILPGVSLPLGLGDIAVDTRLNQPLHAEIKLISVRPQDVEDIRIKLAPAAAFDRAGISRPYVLSQLEFTPTVKNGGQAVISVTTKKPIREPFLNFLVEVEWPKGRLRREYTILLDPPAFAERQPSREKQASSLDAAAGAVVNRSVESAQPQRVRSLSNATTRVTQSNPQSTGLAESASGQPRPIQAESGTYKTQRGDTLSTIVRDRMLNYGLSLQQTMIATLRANPQAFVDNNINYLKTGELLRFPNQSEVESISRQEARAETTSQYARWRESRTKSANGLASQAVEPQARVQILASDDDTEVQQPSAPVAGAGDVNVTELQTQVALMQELAESRQKENEELSSRVQELEAIIAKQDRLINLQSEEMAKLQQQRAERVAVDTTDTSAEPAPSSESPQPAEVVDSNEGQSAVTTLKEEGSGDAEKPQTEAQPEDSPAVNSSVLDDLLDSSVLPLGLAGIGLLLAVLAWIIMRGSQKGEQGAIAESKDQVFQQEKVVGRSVERQQRGHEPTEELLSSRQTKAEAKRADEETQSLEAKYQDAATSDSDRASEASPEDGALTDADVYIAYGMHQEAEERLKDVIAKHPEREDYQVKLLEVYRGAGNREAFDALAQQLHDGRLAAGPLWERVLTMGREISPDNPLYTVGEPKRAATTTDESNDEELQKNIDRFITDLEQDAELSAADESQVVDVSPESEDTAEDTNRLLQFDVGDLDFETKPGKAQDTDSDAQKLEVANEELLDFDLSDLELDDALKDPEYKESVNRKPKVDVSGSDADRSIEKPDSGAGSAEDRPTEILEAFVDNYLFDEPIDQNSEVLDSDFDAAAVDKNEDGKSVGDAGFIPAYQPEIEPQLDEPADIESILEGQLEVRSAESKRATEELEISDRDTAILPPQDEVSTKLDLARAYIDMGDADGARSTLEEVLEEGDNEQCKAAEELLKQIA